MSRPLGRFVFRPLDRHGNIRDSLTGVGNRLALDEAIARANDGEYGLNGSIYSRDTSRWGSFGNGSSVARCSENERSVHAPVSGSTGNSTWFWVTMKS